MILALAAGLAACAPEVEVGRRAFAEHCAVCHGAGGTGDGRLATMLKPPPPDLTRLAAENGGVFPLVHVMSVIDGYTRRDQHGGTMPEFGALLGGRIVLVRMPDGTQTPTPEPLAALAAYLEQVQK
jgi:mono/diheme cytochrome c family protein